jgi:hypothetical protein
VCRTGGIALADLREVTLHKTGVIPVTEESRRALEILLERFTSGRPKELIASVPRKPHLLFTDGALEYNELGNPEASIGGVLIDRDGKTSCFGCNVPEPLLQIWQASGRTHVIGLVELYAAVVGLHTWRNTFKNDRVILFTDSWPAYDAVVKGTAGVKEWRELLLVLEKTDESHPMHLWTARVPSASNPADPPSRKSVSDIAFLGDVNIIDAECPGPNVFLRSYEMA